MRKEIVSALKTKFPGLSDGFINFIAEKLCKTVTNTEDIAEAVEKVDAMSFVEGFADFRASESQRNSISNYEKKYGLKDGEKVEEKVKPSGQVEKKKDEEESELAKQLKAMTERLNKLETERAADSRKAKFNELISGLPDTIKKTMEDNFELMKFEDEDAFNSWIDKTKPNFEKITTDFKIKGAVVKTPKGGSGNSKDEEENPYLKERIDEQKAVSVAPAIKGLQTEN